MNEQQLAHIAVIAQNKGDLRQLIHKYVKDNIDEFYQYLQSVYHHGAERDDYADYFYFETDVMSSEYMFDHYAREFVTDSLEWDNFKYYAYLYSKNEVSL